MRILAVKKIVSAPRDWLLESDSFQGRLTPSSSSESSWDRWEPGANIAPLEVIRSGTWLPDFFDPDSGVWIVTRRLYEEIVQKCGRPEGISFAPVKFAKLVDADEQSCQPGKSLYKKYKKWRDPDTFFESLPDVPILHDIVPPCFEIRGRRVPGLGYARNEGVQFPTSPDMSEARPAEVVPGEIFPCDILKVSRTRNVVGEELARVMLSYINPKYFYISWVDLSNGKQERLNW
jgi:hypothetical protein